MANRRGRFASDQFVDGDTVSVALLEIRLALPSPEFFGNLFTVYRGHNHMCEWFFDLCRTPPEKEINQVKIMKDTNPCVAIDQLENTKVIVQVVTDIINDHIVGVSELGSSLEKRPVKQFDPFGEATVLDRRQPVGRKQRN